MKNKKKFGVHPSVAKGSNIAPIVRLPSGQRFDRDLYKAFFTRQVELLGEFEEVLLKVGRDVWTHCLKCYRDSLPEGVTIEQMQVSDSKGHVFGFVEQCSVDYSGEHNGYLRFLIMLLIQPSAPNQIADAYDFSNCDPRVPERTFHKHDSLTRTLITQLATEFGARVHYFLRNNPNGTRATQVIVEAKNRFNEPVNKVTIN